MTATKMILLLFLTNLWYSNILAAAPACPKDCPDEKPPRQASSCQQIAADGFCGSRLTGGSRYCQCSCKTCAALAVASPPPPPPPTGPKDGWFTVNAPKTTTASPPIASPLFFTINAPKITPASPSIASLLPFTTNAPKTTTASPSIASPLFSTINAPKITTASPSIASPLFSTINAPTTFSAVSAKPSSIPTKKFSGGSTTAVTQTVPATEIGLAVGGSRGIDTFRRNIDNNKLPALSDITYEGIFNDYFFDVSDQKPCTSIFCAKYSGAISEDPFFGVKEFFIAAGLETGLKLKDFKRKDLDLVIVLDVSGSMGSRFGDFPGITAAEKNLKKLDVAKDAIKNVLKHLTSRDKLAIVTFASTSKTVLGLRTMDSVGKSAATRVVNGIRASGPTNLEAGLKTAANQVKRDSRQNRLIVITDANANRGEFSSAGLAQLISEYANRGDPIYTSLIGVGLDFNTELTDRMLQTRGANYFSVFSPKELRNKLDEEFDFMVTPLVYDLKLEIEQRSLTGSNGWEIAKAYGVPNKDAGVSGNILSVNTLFPSPKTADGIKGGIILLQMKPKSANPNPLYIKVSYLDPNFVKYQGSDQITLFTNLKDEFYGTIAIRKAILLVRYVDLLSFWLFDVAPKNQLVVPKQSGDDFVIFLFYLNNQNVIIKDSDLDREADLLRKLIGLSA